MIPGARTERRSNRAHPYLLHSYSSFPRHVFGKEMDIPRTTSSRFFVSSFVEEEIKFLRKQGVFFVWENEGFIHFTIFAEIIRVVFAVCSQYIVLTAGSQSRKKLRNNWGSGNESLRLYVSFWHSAFENFLQLRTESLSGIAAAQISFQFSLFLFCSLRTWAAFPLSAPCRTNLSNFSQNWSDKNIFGLSNYEKCVFLLPCSQYIVLAFFSAAAELLESQFQFPFFKKAENRISLVWDKLDISFACWSQFLKRSRGGKGKFPSFLLISHFPNNIFVYWPPPFSFSSIKSRGRSASCRRRRPPRTGAKNLGIKLKSFWKPVKNQLKKVFFSFPSPTCVWRPVQVGGGRGGGGAGGGADAGVRRFPTFFRA